MKLPSFGPLTRSSLLACASLCATAPSLFAASQTWGTTPPDSLWPTTANWLGGASPGTAAGGYTNATRNNDVATFSLAVGTIGSISDPVQVDANRFLKGLTFDTATAGNYAVGIAGGAQLQLDQGGLIQVNAAVVTPQTVNADIRVRAQSQFNPTYTLRNNATDPAAKLTIGGTLQVASSTGRGTNWVLDGTNTGDNLVSGVFSTSGGAGTGGFTALTKAGTGTWRITGANTLPGVTINDGVLIVDGATALGTGAVTINGGILSINNAALGNSNITLNPTGTLRANGASSVVKVTVSNTALGSATIATLGAADVLTLGPAANSFTGGATDSVIHIAGPGTVVQPAASNYAGTWSVDAGTLSLGSPTALGTLGSVNVASGAKLQTLGNSVTLTSLTGSGAVTNGVAGISTLTTNIAGTNSFAGPLQDGSAGTLGLNKTGAGTLNLSGSSNYTDLTTVTTGVLNVTGSLGNTAVSVGTGASLSGNGTIGGVVTVATGAHIAPGDGGDANIGTLTVGGLALDPDSQLDFGITDTTTLDRVTVTGSNGLAIQGGQVNINGGTTAFTTNGVYSLIGYSGSIGGNGVSSLSVNGLNKSVTKNYSFGTSGGFVTLSVTNSGTVQNFWNANADGNWSVAGNWTPGIPNSVGAFVGFGGGGTEITADRTITVNGAFTAGTLAFNGAANNRSYTLAAGTGAHLTLDNNLAGSFVTDTAGSHTINAPLTLASNGTTFTVLNAADTLTVGGVIDGVGNPLVKGGAGTLALTATNSYANGTTINAGTLLINNAASLGDASQGTTTINAGTLRVSSDIASTGFFRVGDAASAIAVPAATTFTIDGVIEDAVTVGTLNKNDAGTLALNGSNTYSGGTVINAGVVQINNANSLGNVGGGVTIKDALLQATATFTGARNVTLSHANSRISADSGATYTINAPINGTGTLNKVGDGTVSLGSNTNTWSGGTVLQAGILALNAGSFLGPGTVTFQGGTLQNNYGTNNTYGMGNPIFVAAGQTGTINMGSRMSLGAGAVVTGAGTLNVNFNTTQTRDDFNNDWRLFTGQLNIAGNGTGRMNNNGSGATFIVESFANCSVDLSGNAFLSSSTNSNGNTYPIGALSGSSPTAGFSGGVAGRSTLSIGALNTSTTFAGQINGNSALIKVGSGTLTLTGTYNYTGNTTVTGGTLSLSTGTLSDTGVVNIGAQGILNLNFQGTDSVNDLFIDGVEQADGEWGAINSGAAHETAFITGGGRLMVLPDDAFLPWIAQFPTLTGDIAAKGADPDQDGLSNLQEFALDGNPTVSAPNGKVRAQIETVGTDKALVITLPVRNGGTFAGTVSKTATIDGVIYTVEGSNTLAIPFDQVVTEVTPASTTDMPALSAGWTYHTFRLDGAIGGATPRGPRGFLRTTVVGATP